MSMPRSFAVSQVVLRVMAMALTAAALAVLMTSDQPLVIHGNYIGTAHYAYSSAFSFIAIADAIVCGGSALSLVILLVLLRRGKPYPNGFLIYAFVYDQTLASLMLAACSAATAVGLVGRFGLTQNNWAPVCGLASKFCNKVSVSVAFSFVSSSCYGTLALMSVKKIQAGNNNYKHDQRQGEI